MEQIVTAEQMRQIEAQAMEGLGIPAIVLMERAAMAIADAICDRVEKQNNVKVLIVCGNGNNGADGFALGRILIERGCFVDVCDAMDVQKRSELNKLQYDVFHKLSVQTRRARIVSEPWGQQIGTIEVRDEYDVVVDSVLGIGVNRPLSDKLMIVVRWMNQLSGLKVALDQPTGIDTDRGIKLGDAFQADLTVTFGAKKAGLYLGDGKVYSGCVIKNSCAMQYGDLAIDKQCENLPEMFSFERPDLKQMLVRDPQGNKGSFGKIGIMAGSESVGGAPLLCARGAFCSGAGYIRLMTHAVNRRNALESVPEVVLSLYDDSHELDVDACISFARVLVAGPGIGTDDTAKANFDKMIAGLEGLDLETRRQKPFLLDADALNLIAKDDNLLNRICSLETDVILTPHLLEFARLCKYSVEEIKQNRIEIAKQFAAEHHLILVLKDAQTIVVSPEGKVYINTTGNDGMAVAGSGDVLSGVIASMAGQGLDPFMAACAGVYLHGLAGDIAAERLGRHGMMPSNLIDCLSEGIHKICL